MAEKRLTLAQWKEKLKLVTEKAQPSHQMHSIGKSKVNGKWYGYSHRAIVGFKTKEAAKRFAKSVS